MKKIFLFALILGLTTQLAGQRPPTSTSPQSSALSRDAETALKNYEKTKTDVTGKKAQDAASWVKFGNNILAVYDLPAKNLWTGLTSLEARVVLKDQRSSGTETITLGDEEYNVTHYPDKDLYYTANGSLAFWVVTKPLLPQDLLGEAYDSFQKGFELDTKGAQKKTLSEGLSKLQAHYVNEAMTAYSLGNHSFSSQNFGNALRCMEHPVINKIDTLVVFYTGLTAYYAKEYERATEYLQRAISLGYAQDGAAYSILAECYKALDKADTAETTLAEGFMKYPANQAILISLINMYRDNDEDPVKLMDYIHKAQENEPTNESLFYVEGEMWKKLNNIEKAIACFEKSIEINPKYFYGYYSIGQIYYDAAVDIQNKAAEELDDNKWTALMKEMDQLLIKAVTPFETCYTLSDNTEFQSDIAVFLRTTYYRLQANDEKYTPLYEKYKALSEGR